MVGDTANKFAEACSKIAIRTLPCVPKNTYVKINDLASRSARSNQSDCPSSTEPSVQTSGRCHSHQ
jgi:hypothetical protein